MQHTYTHHKMYHLAIKIFLLFIYFWLCWIFAAALVFPLAVVRGVYSLVAVHGLFIAETASLGAEHGL